MSTQQQQQQQMKDLVEMVGECWHEVSNDQQVFENNNGLFNIRYCVNCEKPWNLCINKNPSSNDLKELFGIAKKLGITVGVQSVNSMGEEFYEAWADKSYWNADTPEDALREALWKSLKELNYESR